MTFNSSILFLIICMRIIRILRIIIYHTIQDAINTLINIIGGEIHQDTKLYTHQFQICSRLLEKNFSHFKDRLQFNYYLIINQQINPKICFKPLPIIEKRNYNLTFHLTSILY